MFEFLNRDLFMLIDIYFLTLSLQIHKISSEFELGKMLSKPIIGQLEMFFVICHSVLAVILWIKLLVSPTVNMIDEDNFPKLK